MDVQRIATIAHLPARLVRYILDQRLLPGLRVRLQRHLVGQPRSFTALEGFGIACAAVMLQGGIRRQIVIDVFDFLADMTWTFSKHPPRARPRKAVEALFNEIRSPLQVIIADGVHIRLLVGKIDTGWLEPKTQAQLAPQYQPRITITLDLKRLQDAFLREDTF